MAIARTTELQAVNTMLSAVGEPPITHLEGQKNADAAIARNILTEISRDVQTAGWHFNLQKKVSLTPDSSSFIYLPDNVVRVDIDYWTDGTGSGDRRDITQRGDRLFNRTDNSYKFTKAVVATVVYLLEWTELPEPVRRFITVQSSRVFQDRMVGSQAHHQFSQEDEVRARALLREFEMDTADTSIFDNYDTYKSVARRSALRGSSF
jgi:hypothetical protein